MSQETTIFIVALIIGAIIFVIIARLLQELFDRFIHSLADKITNIFKKKD